MNTRRLFSVGIDVGTTTTQVIFSALEVTNRAPVNQVPRYEFSSREILFQSPVIFTPFTSDRKVDVAQLLSFIDAQFSYEFVNGTFFFASYSRETNRFGYKDLAHLLPNPFAPPGAIVQGVLAQFPIANTWERTSRC